MYFLFKMGILHCYVCLPEGIDIYIYLQYIIWDSTINYIRLPPLSMVRGRIKLAVHFTSGNVGQNFMGPKNHVVCFSWVSLKLILCSKTDCSRFVNLFGLSITWQSVKGMKKRTLHTQRFTQTLRFYHRKRKRVFRPSFFSGYAKLWESLPKCPKKLGLGIL